MRLESAAMAKGFRAAAHVRNFPTPGSRVRAVYDFFMAHKGEPVAYTRAQQGRDPIPDLTDYYGLDLRCIRPGQWVLAGEWQGPKYLDFIAEKIGASNREAPQ